MRQGRAVRRAEGKARKHLRCILKDLKKSQNLAERTLRALKEKELEMVALRREIKRLKDMVANAAGQLFLERLEVANA